MVHLILTHHMLPFCFHLYLSQTKVQQLKSRKSEFTSEKIHFSILVFRLITQSRLDQTCTVFINLKDKIEREIDDTNLISNKSILFILIKRQPPITVLILFRNICNNYKVIQKRDDVSSDLN